MLFRSITTNDLKKAFDEGFREFNHIAIDGTIKKAYNSNNNIITKKRNTNISQLLRKTGN